MRKLSEIEIKDKIAYCEGCKEYFNDDILYYGSLYCPNQCGCVLYRGYTE